MNDYLLRHAIDNVWCNPTMDKQFVYQLRQLTPKFGVKLQWGIDFDMYKLPSDTDLWHVYQIGQVVPSLMGLPKLYNQWMSLDKLANELKVLCDVFVSSGIRFPMFDTYILLTTSQNLVVAVKRNSRFPELDEHVPFLHVYSNAFFNSKRSIQTPLYDMKVQSVQAQNLAHIRQLQIEWMDRLAAVGGHVLYYVNGRFVHEISAATAEAGDYLEWVHDLSIKGFYDFKLTGLPSFVSKLDSMRKYLLHAPGKKETTIQYFDDMLGFLYRPNPLNATQFDGVYYHSTDGKWLRMLSHQDWSTPADRPVRFVAEHPEDPRHGSNPGKWPSIKWTSIAPLTLRLYTRHSGYQRPVVADCSRLQELYRLSDANIVRAMVGDDSTSVWHASNLEQSPYVEFMSADPELIFPVAFQRPEANSPGKVTAQNFAGDVFGYHESAHILARNPCPIITYNNVRYAELAYNYWENATIFEYDQNGLLIEMYYHTAGTRWQVQNSTCQLVEAISGQGGSTFGDVYGNDPVAVGGGFNFRVYVCPVWAGVPTLEWQDITDLENRHDWGFLDDTTDNHRWVWTAASTAWMGMVRQDRNFLVQKLNFNKTDGVIRFTLGSNETFETQYQYRLLEIPPGQLDVFLNKRSLVYGLDYQIEGMQVVINNLEYLNPGVNDVQEVIYRGHGFCGSDLKMYEPGEIGWVEYGVISNNGTYNVHRHKMQRLTIGGGYWDPANAVFEEDMTTGQMTQFVDATPYQITTPQSRFRDVYDTDKQARIKDDAIDAEVSAFMTKYFPGRDRGQVDTFRNHYHVFSVFANKVLHDIMAGRLNPAAITGRYTDEQIRTWLKPYEWLVPFDIVNRDYNKNHVEVYPHWHTAPVSLNQYQYAFFKRILGLYLRDPMDLSQFIIQTG